jgi:ATP-dependent helicase/nuclease subunit B
VIGDVETVAFGRPATEALARAIVRAKQAGPLAPVTVVVASNFVGLSIRRLLGGGALGGSGLANVSFLTPLQLVELLAPAPPAHLRPLTNPVLGAAVRRVLSADPGPLRDVAHHPATEAAVARLYAELSHVSAATLDALEATGGMAAVSVGLVRRLTDVLGGFYGEPDVAQAVADHPGLGAESARVGHLVWHLPEPSTPSLERAMGALSRAVDTSVVVGLTGAPEADAPTRALCGRLGIPLDASANPEPAVALRLISVPDPDEEARAAVREVVALAEAGVPLDRVAILVPVPDPYVRSLEQHLAEAGVPHNAPSRDRLADSVPGRTLLAALALPEQQWRRDQVMALVSGAPVRGEAGATVRPTTWERLTRRAGVVHGLADWRRKLAGRRVELAESLAALHETNPEQRSRIERDLADVDELVAFVDGLARRLQAVSSADGWVAKTEAARELLLALLGTEPRHHVWPEAEQDAFTRVLDALARLGTLDELDPRPSHPVFLRALTAELDVGRGRHGRFGEGVLVGPLSAATGQDLDAVIVLGLAEGVCPSLRREDSLLPDAARAIAPPGQLRLRAERLHDQHRWVLAALAAAPPNRRVLVHPRGSLRGRTPHLPSRWLLQSASAVAGRPVDSSEWPRLAPPLVEVVTSHAEAVCTSATPVSLAERDLAQLWARAQAGADLTVHPAAGGPAARGIRCLVARRSPAFTEFDGNLARVPIPSPTEADNPLSPTGLQEWASCGFRYFLSHVLHLRSRDEPERIHELDARDRGSGVHAILETFLREVLEQGAPEPRQAWTPAQRRRLHELADQEFDRLESLGRTGRAVTWRVERARLHRLLDEFLSDDDVKRAAWSSRPVRVEMPFGRADVEPVTVPLPDGRSVRFRGVADRVDRTDDGRWIVLDYKTGRGTAYRALDVDPFGAGTTLQLGVYAEAARQHLGGGVAEAYYWMVDQAARYATYGYEWTPERRERFAELVAAMVEGIEAGVFPAVPGEYDHFRASYDNCRSCDYDRVCPAQRASLAEAKVAAPELAVRARLVGSVDPTDDESAEEAP